MASHALLLWRTVRRERLDQLLALHQLAGPGGVARVEQVEWALVLRLAAEFQGFARDLHDLTASVYAVRVADGRGAVDRYLQNILTTGRGLDRGNAHPGALGTDFARFGLRLWPELRARHPGAQAWDTALSQLNAARNAVAHDNSAEIADLSRRGSPPALASFLRWRAALDLLAAALDDSVAAFVEETLGSPRPW